MSKYKDRIAKGLCGTCGKENASRFNNCDSCREKTTNRSAVYKSKKIERGLCRDCGKTIERGSARCAKCKSSQMSRFKNSPQLFFESVARLTVGDKSRWTELRDIFDRQSGKCAYSGLQLTIGEDAHLDHRIPSSKGGSNDTSNLQWVHSAINRMKWNLDEEEFLVVAKKVMTALLLYTYTASMEIQTCQRSSKSSCIVIARSN